MIRILLPAILLPALALAHEYGPDPRLTAGPGDNPLACSTSGCHTGLTQGGPLNAFAGGVTAIFSSGSSYTPGGPAITITVNVTDPKNTHFGFQMSARLESNLSNGQAGDFNTVGTNELVICDDGSVKRTKCPPAAPVEFIEHAYPQGSQVSTTPYTFTWTPPATNVGRVHFYLAGNSVNGDLVANASDHVYTNSYVLTPVLCSTATPVISGVVSAGAFGALPNLASGSWIEIYGSNFSNDTWGWQGIDFSDGKGLAGSNAPATLAGINVSVDGKPAYIDIVSTGQVNAQVPADTTTGPVKITVSSCSGTSSSFPVQKAAQAPGLLAPPSFKVNGTQYLVAVFADGTYAGNPALIPGTARPAKPGDTLYLYGIGFGDVTASDGTSIPPGVVVGKSNTLVNPVSVGFGSAKATVAYDGLAGNFVGLYLIIVTVPSVADGDVPINVTQGGTPLAQQLVLTIHH